MKFLRPLVTIAVCLVPQLVAAQPATGSADATRRRTLIIDSEAAQRAGNHDVALQRALDASAIQMTPSLRRFIADEYEALGRYRQASFHATTCAREAEQNLTLNNRDAILRHCQELATRLQSSGAWVRLSNADRAPDAARVVVEGEDLPRASWGQDVLVRSGSVVVRAEMPDGTAVERRVSASVGAHEPVELPWRLLRGELPESSSRTQGPVHEAGSTGPGAWPWVLVGVGVASVGAAVLTNVLVVQHVQSLLDDECTPRGGRVVICRNPDSAATNHAEQQRGLAVEYVAFGVGGTALASGLLWYFLSPRNPAPRYTATVTITREGGMIGVGGWL
jgi:hypothetical protein